MTYTSQRSQAPADPATFQKIKTLPKLPTYPDQARTESAVGALQDQARRCKLLARHHRQPAAYVRASAAAERKTAGGG